MVKKHRKKLKEDEISQFRMKKTSTLLFLTILHLNLVTEIVSRNKNVRQETIEQMKEMKHESFVRKA